MKLWHGTILAHLPHPLKSTEGLNEPKGGALLRHLVDMHKRAQRKQALLICLFFATKLALKASERALECIGYAKNLLQSHHEGLDDRH